MVGKNFCKHLLLCIEAILTTRNLWQVLISKPISFQCSFYSCYYAAHLPYSEDSKLECFRFDDCNISTIKCQQYCGCKACTHAVANWTMYPVQNPEILAEITSVILRLVCFVLLEYCFSSVTPWWYWGVHVSPSNIHSLPVPTTSFLMMCLSHELSTLLVIAFQV